MNAPSGHWMWRDLDADGQMDAGEYVTTQAMALLDGGYGASMDTNGTIYSCVALNQLNTLSFKGLDGNGIPIYDGTVRTQKNLAPFQNGGKLKRMRYVPGQDVMYLGGALSNDLPYDWPFMGNTLTCTNSTLYTGPVTVSSTMTLNARAFKAGLADSYIIGGLYALRSATPTFSLIPTTYTTTQQVAISSANSGAVIRYTTDGSDPTVTSTIYTTPVSIAATTTLKARAFVTGLEASDVASGTYAIVATRIVAPGFEQVSSLWTYANGGRENFDKRSGSWGFYTNNTAGTVSQTIGILPNRTYTLRAWGKASAAQGAYIFVKDFGGTSASVASPIFSDEANYSERTITFTTGAISTSATIGFYSQGYSAYVDDFSIDEVVVTVPTAPSALSATPASSSQINLACTPVVSSVRGEPPIAGAGDGTIPGGSAEDVLYGGDATLYILGDQAAGLFTGSGEERATLNDLLDSRAKAGVLG